METLRWHWRSWRAAHQVWKTGLADPHGDAHDRALDHQSQIRAGRP